MSSNIEKDYEAKHLANIQKAQKKIKAAYKDVINKIYLQARSLKPKGKVFRITDYPVFSKYVDKLLLEFRDKFGTTVVNGINGQWQMATEKNAAVIHKLYDQSKIIDQVTRKIYDPQAAALEGFVNRKIAGLDLSDRVWKYTNQFRTEIEQNLYAGIQEGKSAAAMARDQLQYLENPSQLFRRVRDAEGTLQLSEAAKAYHPGQGVYRSSYKNAMRLTRTTINDAYRSSDMVRYQTLPFILSYNVNLSNNHPKTDFCDDLQGVYPVTFVWTSWHVQCLCYCTSNLASPKEFERYQEAILNGTADKFKFSQVEELPDQFNSYVKKRKVQWINGKGSRIG